MNNKHEKLGLNYTNSPIEKTLRVMRKASWILLISIVAGAGIGTCCAIVDDIKEETALRAEKECDIERP